MNKRAGTVFINKFGLLYSADWTHGLDSRTGLADWTRGLDSRQCADEKSDCKIQVIMMTVINGLARQD